MSIGMLCVGWLIVAIMLAGMLLIVSLKLALKSDQISDTERKSIEMILDDYYSRDFGGKLQFIVAQGAFMWSNLMFGKNE